MSDVLQPLVEAGPRLERAVIEAILARPDVAPRLAALITDEAIWSDDAPRAWAAVHATFLIASLKPTGALDLLLAALHRADDYDIAPVINEMPTLLASFGPAVAPSLIAASRDVRESFTVRTAALDTLTILGLKHAELAADVGEELRRVAANDDEEIELRENAAISLLNYAEKRDRALLVDLLEEIFDRESINVAIAGESPWCPDLTRSLLAFYEEPDPALKFEDEAEPIDDEAFDEDVELPDEIEGLLEDEAPASQELFSKPPELFVVERNAPCPCGSGKKYKSCCGNKS